MVPTASPASTITPMMSSRRSAQAPMAMPMAGKIPLVTRAATALMPSECSRL